jgi:hypothetical protein
LNEKHKKWNSYQRADGEQSKREQNQLGLHFVELLKNCFEVKARERAEGTTVPLATDWVGWTGWVLLTLLRSLAFLVSLSQVKKDQTF